MYSSRENVFITRKRLKCKQKIRKNVNQKLKFLLNVANKLNGISCIIIILLKARYVKKRDFFSNIKNFGKLIKK